MFKRTVLLAGILAIHSVDAFSQVSWTSLNGPWYSLVDEIAIGTKNDAVTLYAADSSNTSLMKSTDRGDSWTHVFSGGIEKTVACKSSDPDLVYTAIYGEGVYKSTNGGSSWSRAVGFSPKHYAALAGSNSGNLPADAIANQTAVFAF